MAYATPDELANALRLTRRSPDDDAKLQACLDAAAEEIDAAVDREDPIPAGDAVANRVNLLRGVEWWKANDAPFGLMGFDQIGALQTPRDTFARHFATLLRPLKQRFGVA